MNEESSIIDNRERTHVEVRRTHIYIVLSVVLLVIFVLIGLVTVALVLESKSSYYIRRLCEKLIENC